MSNLHISAEQWLRELFLDTPCCYCGQGEEAHDAIPFMGNWFARCHSEGQPSSYQHTHDEPYSGLDGELCLCCECSSSFHCCCDCPAYTTEAA